jgi:hypothetical protein
MESKEDGNLTATCQVRSVDIHNVATSFRQRRHSGCFTALPQVSHRPERQDQGSKGPSWCRQEIPGLYDIVEPCCTADTGATSNHTGRTHINHGLYTYMTSYLAQTYRLSILIDKPTLCINSWLMRVSVDNVLLINTRSLSIVIDKPIPLSIGISSVERNRPVGHVC